jgi:hypothetical protein
MLSAPLEQGGRWEFSLPDRRHKLSHNNAVETETSHAKSTKDAKVQNRIALESDSPETVSEAHKGVRARPKGVENFTVSLPFGGIFSAVKFQPEGRVPSNVCQNHFRRDAWHQGFTKTDQKL